MNPTARRLYNLSLALTVLALACAIAFISSDLANPAGWLWAIGAFALLILAYVCLGFAETEARRS